MTKNDNYYYDIKKDIMSYPDAWCYIIFGGRNTGKTYSSLKLSVEEKHIFVYAKRTIEDVKLICAGANDKSKVSKYNINLSPFKSLNRDLGWNIKPVIIYPGLGGFFECDIDGEPYGEPIGYIVAMSAITKFKGFDMSECDYLIFDEFVPKMFDRTIRFEGDQILELYKTISRDREHRGLPPLKLICLANSDNCVSPTTQVLEITDNIVQLSLKKEAKMYIEDRGIFIHRIIDNPEFMEKEKQSAIYKAMANTQWGHMALDNDFSYNDFSNINKIKLKNYAPLCKFIYKTKDYYIYYKDSGEYFVTDQKSNNKIKQYDLIKDNDQRSFFEHIVIDLMQACKDGRVVFKYYSIYDVFLNYKKYFKI